MSDNDEDHHYAHDDEGNSVRVRYGQPPEGTLQPRGTIRPVTLDEMPAIHLRNMARDAAAAAEAAERRRNENMERQRKAEAERLKEQREADAKPAADRPSTSLLNTPPRKLDLDTNDNKGGTP
ncbi:hypothetical protein NGM99_10120 [Mesorhizobium sp. RP14(2022)]|uniref:Uncharacterized protein n=1 Tax=Mesorhizobium liriopis TaxID=2953882 RepID=A0ABT1C5N4_9HYPH|nr:hypothetical protein [Mesorhizobium liriopis]MCO6050147.1 hypothetical protein [Mesorhizobium liriopis]